jgi:hypothetical protein
MRGREAYLHSIWSLFHSVFDATPVKNKLSERIRFEGLPSSSLLLWWCSERGEHVKSEWTHFEFALRITQKEWGSAICPYPFRQSVYARVVVTWCLCGGSPFVSFCSLFMARKQNLLLRSLLSFTYHPVCWRSDPLFSNHTMRDERAISRLELTGGRKEKEEGKKTSCD